MNPLFAASLQVSLFAVGALTGRSGYWVGACKAAEEQPPTGYLTHQPQIRRLLRTPIAGGTDFTR